MIFWISRFPSSSRGFFFQAEDGIRDQPRSRGLGDVYKRQIEIDLEKLNDDFQGFCTEIDDRVFHVQIEKRLRDDDFLTCLFHELTHVEQHLRNKFGIREDNDKMHYLDRPYEIDAYTKQEQLLEEYRLCS